jgi:hypothetical protein
MTPCTVLHVQVANSLAAGLQWSERKLLEKIDEAIRCLTPSLVLQDRASAAHRLLYEIVLPPLTPDWTALPFASGSVASNESACFSYFLAVAESLSSSSSGTGEGNERRSLARLEGRERESSLTTRSP